MNFENVLAAGFTVSSGTAVLQELATLPDNDFPQVVTVGPTAIQTEQDAQVEFTWSQTGPLVPWITATWRFDVFLEQMGPTEGPAIPYKTDPFVGTIGSKSYIVPIAKNTIPVGLYRVTARMMLIGPGLLLDTAVSPIVAFEDLGFVQYHNS
jgi:hypothetical protein